MAKDSNKDKVSRAEAKRKEREVKRGKDITQQDGTRTAWSTIRWITGLILLLFSLYVLIASVSHLFVWKQDIGMLGQEDADFANLCGPGGARIANFLLGDLFGAFGVLLPIIVFLFGGYLLLERSRVLWRTSISIMLITLCGSLTLSLITGADGVFGTGLGGHCGIISVEWLESQIGVVGVICVLVASWILTGIIINLHFIDFLKRTTENSVDRSKSLLQSFKEYLARKREARELRRQESLAQEETDDHRIIGGDEEPQEEPTEETQIETTIDESPFKDDEDIEEEVEEIAEPQEDSGSIEVFTHKEGVLSEEEADSHEVEKHHTPSYKFPSVDILVSHDSGATVSDDEILMNKQRIEATLNNFGVPIVSMTATIGPTVTLYEIVQEAGVKIAKVQGLEKDIAQSLKAPGIRIIAPIPGKGTIGIEVPNINKETVSMRSAIQSERFQNFKAELPVVIGRTIQNENFVFDLAKLPHLLVAGATGQGKSVGLNAIITSLLYRKDPSELKFVMIDPKMVEFSLYSRLEQHYMAKMASEERVIVTDAKKAVNTMHALCVEMENRLRKYSDVGARNIVEFNDLVRKGQTSESDIIPYIVVVVDEFADLIQTAKEVEQPVMRLAAKARAAGIHLILATQRPDVKVITGTIKANFPARIAFRVIQMIDSRTIIDQPGANQLIGRGDMLMSINGELTRIQCAYVDTPEVQAIVEHIANQPHPLNGTYELPDYEDNGSSSGGDMGLGSESSAPTKFDPKFAEIARDIVSSGRFSVSYVQSSYEVGFNRAGRIAQQLERAGIIGPANGAKPREVRIYDLPSLEAKLQELGIG